jgi:ATP-dependent DNA helicase RecG
MKGKFNPREFMELAVKVMKESVSESRFDGKIDPKVGAVLVKPDGTVETAYRGELRHGDHAEFTLLERKNRGNKLDGSILFATLEPCAPGARSDRKTDCAERIRLARIKEVWVGIQDPDPKVARKGIAHLEKHGILVHMFDRDLQEVIEKESQKFLKQALERADEAKKKKDELELFPLEARVKNLQLSAFSDKALTFYRDTAKISELTSSKEFKQRLLSLGMIKKTGKELVPTGFGILAFGKEPRSAMQQAGLLALINYPNGERERKEFDEPLILIPSLLEKWLKNKLPNVFTRDDMNRKEGVNLPFEMIREAVVNALIHRDYSVRGAKCQLTVTEDTVVIKSPGLPPSPITIEQLQKFTAPMLSRNPELHFIFARLELAEEQGLGIESLRDKAKEKGLPLPVYAWEDPYLALTLYRSLTAVQHGLKPQVLESLSRAEQRGWQWLSTQEVITAAAYALELKIPKRTALNHFKRFVESGLLRRMGTGPSTKYEIVR